MLIQCKGVAVTQRLSPFSAAVAPREQNPFCLASTVPGKRINGLSDLLLRLVRSSLTACC
ncbi:hypothetical protein EB241_04965 [Erwinia psidii]|uniref:Uncharacterized protein n=1 Tax=Erwinia psidii TaxID=69224 RepID=A0A3N6SJY8_9GAMM|nr:hypothetical protein EB241_04965 [Erwinia psidii]